MISIYMGITVLATIAVAKGSNECNFSESPGTGHCFGAVGQPLLFHLSNKINASVEIKKDGKHRILKIDNQGKVLFNEDYLSPPKGINNKTFKLDKAMKNHSGNYLLEEFGPDGKLLTNVNMYLEVQVAVSKPKVFQTCLSPEQMEVSCFFEGDGVEFSLTLDSQLLMDSKEHSHRDLTAEKSTVSHATINLHGTLTGNFMCQVWNNISRDETVIYLAACKGVTTLTVALIAGVILFFSIAVLSVILKNLLKKRRSTTVNE